ncbi:MAG: Gfo/Idh/MocA family oxidoreductase [Verrucomicrobiales bacterium]|nr:Gfo/Idh/MocA family oxidoreductase [Verrucomicrobiales bacterium]
MREVRVGIIGGGLMGREMASAFARWFALKDMPVRPVLAGVADLAPAVLDWFRQLPQPPPLLVSDYKMLLADPQIDVVYVAVPHHLHEAIYCDVLAAGKDLFAEKPFGIDLGAAERIAAAVETSGRFCRCSSEFPFLPGAHRAYQLCRAGAFGRILEIHSGFHHSSDLDPTKPANWKRLSRTCGEIGVLGDLGMHTLHLPLRLGWMPSSVHAQLQKGYPQRPNPDGTSTACDTWDNAMLHTWTSPATQPDPIPMRLEMKRLAPAATNTWFLNVFGTDGGIRFSTAEPKSIHRFHRGKEQGWERIDLGFETPFPAVTGHIFEPGFPDIMQQMWAAFLLERAGLLDGRLGCVTPAEALASHRIFAAALRSQRDSTVAAV